MLWFRARLRRDWQVSTIRAGSVNEHLSQIHPLESTLGTKHQDGVQLPQLEVLRQDFTNLQLTPRKI